MRYKKEGKFIRDLSTNERFDPTNIRFGDRARTEAAAGQPELYELLTGRATAQPEVRKATDGLDVLLDEIRQERIDEDTSNRIENLVQEARVYLPQRRQELERLGVSSEEVLDNIGRLQGRYPVPMPLMRGDQRTHTQYRTDGITGQELIVPYMTPGHPEQVLKTTMGVRPQGVDQADEVISHRALQLMGYEVVDMPQNNRVADFQVVDRDGNRMAIDGMQGKLNMPIEMQTHAFVAPKKNGGGYMSVGETQALLDRGYQQGQNVIDQIDQLADREMLLHPDTAKAAGKVLRGDRTQYRVPEEMEYDALIMPEYKESIRNGPRQIQPRNIVTPPQAITMADMPWVFDAIKAGQSGRPEVVPNYGGNNNRSGRMQQKDWHKVNVPMSRDTQVDNQRVFIDAVRAEPLVAQLLDAQTMNSLRVS